MRKQCMNVLKDTSPMGGHSLSRFTQGQTSCVAGEGHNLLINKFPRHCCHDCAGPTLPHMVTLKQEMPADWKGGRWPDKLRRTNQRQRIESRDQSRERADKAIHLHIYI